MSRAITTEIPQNIVVTGGYTLRFRAIDPTTGADVSGVKVSKVSILAQDESLSGNGSLVVGPYMLVPGPGA